MKNNTTDIKWSRCLIDIISDLTSNGVELKLTKNRRVFVPEEGTWVSGYCDEEDGRVVLACGTQGDIEDWGTTLIHEYCHFLQWRERSPLWKAMDPIMAEDFYNIITNKPVSKKDLDKCLIPSQNIEADCERRVVKILKKYKIPIDTELYIKRANAYVYFYDHIRDYRKWYPKDKPPYMIKEIIDLCPKTFQKDYSKMPKKLKSVYSLVYPPVKNNRDL